MGKKKIRKPLLAAYGVEDNVQVLAGGDTGTWVNNYGVTYITSTGSGSAGANVYKLRAPNKGSYKKIIGNVSSTKEITVRTHSSAAASNFAATTWNAITFATGSTLAAQVAELVGLSSVQYALLYVGAPLAQSTAVTNYYASLAGATA